MTQIDLIEQKLVSLNQITHDAAIWRFKDQKIVFTNGCFDILHKGHIKLLSEAADQGNVLIVGLNTDSSVKKLKGSGRPVNSENDRALLLSSLRMVDRVILFNEDTPIDLIKAIMPDVIVKGADYGAAEVVGADFIEEIGGRVHLVDLEEGYSSSNYISQSS